MKKQSPKIFNKPWKRVLAAAVGIAFSYGLASWAIDSGRLTAYFAAIVFGIIAIHHIIEAVKGYARQS